MVCSLPVAYVYVEIRGTTEAKNIEQDLTCTDTDMRAINAWSGLLGYERPPLDRD